MTPLFHFYIDANGPRSTTASALLLFRTNSRLAY